VGNDWVVDASPLILLAKAGLVELLPRLVARLVIPAAVRHEIITKRPDPASLWLEGAGAEWVREIGELDSEISAWDLGNGENEVLTWAKRNPSFECILDDREARNCAKVLNLKCRGSLGVVIHAKRGGFISDADPYIDALLAAGYFVEAEIIEEARLLARK